MQVVYSRCCGLDVHKDQVTACVLVLGEDGQRVVRTREFRTYRKELPRLKLWLFANKVMHVAMESTGVYWKPVWHVLEGHFPLMLANPYHMHNIPGRKTDQRDAEWIADLLAHGLLKASFVPGRLVLHGEVNDHHRYMLQELMEDIERIEGKLLRIEAEIVKRTEPYQKQLERLITIPGVDWITVWTILAELGDDMSAFPDAHHAASWAGLVPGSFESAGKRKSSRTRHGNWLRRALCQSAWAVSHKKNCYLTAHFYRRAARSGVKKAIIATAHQILIMAFHILRNGTEYLERGGDHYDQLHPERTQRRLTAKLERLGWQVALTPRIASPEQPPRLRKRGRPCKCAERAIDCKHGRL